MRMNMFANMCMPEFMCQWGFLGVQQNLDPLGESKTFHTSHYATFRSYPIIN